MPVFRSKAVFFPAALPSGFATLARVVRRASLAQGSLFDRSVALIERAPAGLVHQARFITEDEEASLVKGFDGLPFAPYLHRGFEANRSVVRFGWNYAPGRKKGQGIDPLPENFEWLRNRAGAWGGIDPAELEQSMVARYPPGAGIGWHRDMPMFGIVIAVSLLGPSALRLRQRRGENAWDRFRLPLEGRSAYRLSGEARHVWQHSLPPVEALRYSFTFRTLAPEPPGG